MRKRAPRGMSEFAERIASAKPESSAVLLLHDVAPRNAGNQGSHTTRPQMILTKFSGETIATAQPAISVPSILRLRPSVKSLQPGDSLPVSLVVIRQVGSMGKFLFRFRESESFRSELFRMKLHGHRLISMTPRGTQSSHHFDSSVHHKLAEKETRAVVGSVQVVSSDEGVEESSNQYA